MTLSPSDRIIVSLDVPNQQAWIIACKVCQLTDVRFFKLSASNFLSNITNTMTWDMIRCLRNTFNANIMLDLKIYDVPTSVHRIVTDAFAAGARFVTVHPDCVGPAQAVLYVDHAFDDEMKVLPILGLTSSQLADVILLQKHIAKTRAAVCPPRFVAEYRAAYPDATLVCPGIRQATGTDDGYTETWGPAAAVAAGADYLVTQSAVTANCHTFPPSLLRRPIARSRR